MKNEIVYLFRHKGTDHVKIGMTTKTMVDDRFSSFCTYSATGGEIVGLIRCENARQLEAKLHREYEYRRLRGEFFSLSDNDISILLNKYQDEDMKNLISRFYLMITKGELNLDEFIKYSNLLRERKSKLSGDSLSLKNKFDEIFISDELCGTLKVMTATEIREFCLSIGMDEVEKMSMKYFGSFLKSYFGESSTLKINGVGLKRYKTYFKS